MYEAQESSSSGLIGKYYSYESMGLDWANNATAHLKRHDDPRAIMIF